MASILVIDDDDQLRSFLRTLLESEGHRVTEARNGAEGLRHYHRERPDLVLCDLFMPEKEGLETIRELHRLSPHVRVVAMSGGWDKAPSQDFLRLAKFFGAASVLAKPFSTAALLSVVQEALQDSCSACAGEG